MSRKRFHLPARTQETRHAATVCLGRLDDDALSARCLAASPHGAMHAIANFLEQDIATSGSAWIVRATEEGAGEEPDSRTSTGAKRRNVSAWPFWFQSGRQRFEKPLLYLLRSESVTGLRAALCETEVHGIFCNDAEAFRSRWPKSVQPAVPLWLCASTDGTPYDPASGAETLAILRSALHALYIEGESGFVYFSAHAGESDALVLSDADEQHAFQGMYRITARQEATTTSVRLLGAGKMLLQVQGAAELLQEDWGVTCEIWSCPSYTRLARESYEAERWNMLHPLSRKRTSHLQSCLAGNTSPVVAVTGYAQHVASQIGGFIPARFVSIGADSHQASRGSANTQWITAITLKALGDEGAIPLRRAEEALKKYELA